MCENWTNIRRFVRGGFSVTLAYTDETDADLSWADQDTLDLINSGAWGCFLFRVQVCYRGQEKGVDFLGGSVYADPADFATEHRKGRAYFPDMVRAAIAEARNTLSEDRPYIRAA